MCCLVLHQEVFAQEVDVFHSVPKLRSPRWYCLLGDIFLAGFVDVCCVWVWTYTQSLLACLYYSFCPDGSINGPDSWKDSWLRQLLFPHRSRNIPQLPWAQPVIPMTSGIWCGPSFLPSNHPWPQPLCHGHEYYMDNCDLASFGSAGNPSDLFFPHNQYPLREAVFDVMMMFQRCLLYGWGWPLSTKICEIQMGDGFMTLPKKCWVPGQEVGFFLMVLYLPRQVLKPTDRLYVQQIFYRPPPPCLPPLWETSTRMRELKDIFDLFDEHGMSMPYFLLPSPAPSKLVAAWTGMNELFFD